MSGTVRITVTTAVWLPSVRHSAGTTIQLSPTACNTCSPFSSDDPHPDSVTPSPAENPVPMLAALILVHTPSSSSHALPSYRRITQAGRLVSSHRSPVSGSPGAYVLTV